MKKALYIGQYSEGTTSKMRGESLKDILNPKQFQVIDTNLVFYSLPRVLRTIGFKWKVGPLVFKINQQIINQTKGEMYDLIWVDKGVYLYPRIVKGLRKKTKRLIHYTPDTAFLENQSRHFYKSMHLYDYFITTKSFEIVNYENLVSKEKIYFTPQGFNKSLHKPKHQYDEKIFGVAFIGLCEPHREHVVKTLLDNNIPVYVAGQNWQSFISKVNNPNLHYLGEGLFAEDYVNAISKTMFSIGLLSKKFPELHTTRTFEIPACGTALITERNEEVDEFYSDDEVIKYSSLKEMVDKILYFRDHNEQLKMLIEKGTYRVMTGNYDYHSQIELFLKEKFSNEK